MTCYDHDHDHDNDNDRAELGADLERAARLFLARNTDDSDAPATAAFIVADLEFKWDRSRHQGYTHFATDMAKKDPRWPFDCVAAASWMTLRFGPGDMLPEIVAPQTLTMEDAPEHEVVAALFDGLAADPGARLVTWGGECRDLAVLRRAAAEHDLLLPPQLVDLSPLSRQRLDLCSATSVRAADVHLDEYAAATSIPAKPSKADAIGAMVEAGRWGEVQDHAMADVLTTAIILLRHLKSRGEIRCDLPTAIAGLVEQTFAAHPNSAFMRREMKPWAIARLNASRLRGTVYRSN